MIIWSLFDTHTKNSLQYTSSFIWRQSNNYISCSTINKDNSQGEKMQIIKYSINNFIVIPAHFFSDSIHLYKIKFISWYFSWTITESNKLNDGIIHQKDEKMKIMSDNEAYKITFMTWFIKNVCQQLLRFHL